MPDPRATAVLEFLYLYVFPCLSGLVPLIGARVVNFNIVFWNDSVPDHCSGRTASADHVRTRLDVVLDKVQRSCAIVLGGMYWLLYTVVISMMVVMALGLAEVPIQTTICPDGILVFCLSCLAYGLYPLCLFRREAKAAWARAHPDGV